MPGVDSLQQSQYYAHRRNAFWPAMMEIFTIPQNTPYQERLETLVKNHIALWDVIGSCRREKSLDSDIEEGSIIVNDFEHFFNEHPTVKNVLFNGTKAEQSFRRYVIKNQDIPQDLILTRLPSTSPAYAGMHISKKIALWKEALR